MRAMLRYSELYGTPRGTASQLGLIFLDTNVKRLTGTQWAAQLAWLDSTVAAFEADDVVGGVMFFAHHPPFTNSLVVDDDEDVKRDVLPVFCGAGKAVAFLTGHAHGLEHFVSNCGATVGTAPAADAATDSTTDTASKHFIVSGGAGGPRHPRGYHPTSERGHEDVLGETITPRPFNYLLVSFMLSSGTTSSGGGGGGSADEVVGVKLAAHGLDKGETETRVLFEVALEWRTR